MDKLQEQWNCYVGLRGTYKENGMASNLLLNTDGITKTNGAQKSVLFFLKKTPRDSLQKCF